MIKYDTVVFVTLATGPGQCCTSAILITLTALFVGPKTHIRLATISQHHSVLSLVNNKLFPDNEAFPSAKRSPDICFRQSTFVIVLVFIFPPQSPYLPWIPGDIPVFCRPFPSCQKLLLVTFTTINFLRLDWLHVWVRAGHPLNRQVTWRESLTWRSVLCATSRRTRSRPFRRVSLQTLVSPRPGGIGGNPAAVVCVCVPRVHLLHRGASLC